MNARVELTGRHTGRCTARRLAAATLLLFATGCAAATTPPNDPGPIGEPITPPADNGSADTDNAHALTRSRALQLFLHAEAHLTSGLTRRSLTHRRLWDVLRPLADDAPGVRREEIGRSVENRPLYALHIGSGPVRVLLWSQMHGDEPTATLALADLVNYIAASPDDPFVRHLTTRLTITALPMMNPDGAERSRRENANGIDLNRDARRQASPEARALASLHARLSPSFGFNLHDQHPRIGIDGRTVAISLLAPPRDPARSEEAVRTRAKQVAAVMRIAADSLVDGRITKFDETFNPHAFGDAMQSWGTSTVLLETGSWDDDRENVHLRKVNFTLLLTALDAIATTSYARVDVQAYESLPANPPRR